ncbi:maltase A3 isoform X1 [Anopheles gambiae]|uniref:alpha-glucosidase n=1 Tax=Anopheles gambiae TaxID=7165 RepID=A0A1S4H961_ANOGA|nr:maltase A3 isoform X1 [Anopheles gambiae]
MRNKLSAVYSVLFVFWLGLGNFLARSAQHDKRNDNGWWKSAVFYQIYPRSFMDSNGDGIGDLCGITSRLGYLDLHNITGFWLSPIFASPMADFGYDISDYYKIQPEYGTMADFDAMLKKANDLNMEVILDFVPNHTSDEHEWFKKSELRVPGFEDFYIWHPGRPNPNDTNGQPLAPCNWVSFFRGSAWQWSKTRKEYYLHQFSVKQPDLNYRNPAVVEAMKDVMRFWLGRGVAGFRIDAVPTLFEVAPDADGQYPDEPLSGNTNDPDDPGYLVHIYTQDRNETLDMVYQWRAVLDEFQQQYGVRERIIMAETYSPIDIVMKYYGNETVPGAQIPFNFHFITDLSKDSTAQDFLNTINYWIDHMPPMDSVVPNWVLGNHDQHRVASRFGEDMIDSMNMIMLSLPGVAVTYNGEEIGMDDVWISYNDTVDPAACNAGPDRYQYTTRDPERTPFQWDSSKNAGFSTANHTWLPVSPNYTLVNVEKQLVEYEHSHLHVYRSLVRMKQIVSYIPHTLATFVQENVLIILRQANIGGTLSSVYTIANIGNQQTTINLTLYEPSLKVGLLAILSVNSVHEKNEPVLMDSIVVGPKESFVLVAYHIQPEVVQI